MADLLERLTAGLADRYRVDREIGRGGMAHVFLAHDLKLERPVALKVLRPELAAALGSDRFLREITLSAQLDHPHILPLLDSGETDGTLFYTMPYVEGESLRDRLDRESQLPLEEALQLTREVADALSHAHSRGIIHRDIKPENILLAGGHARVADFGIAKAVTEAGGENLTGTGVSIGTPAYMSPEQAEAAKPVDGRSDLYSLGCVLYEMVAGHPPFQGSTAHELLARHATDPVPPLRTGRETVPEPIEAAVEKALAKVPADRFATAAQFRAALSEPAPPSPRPNRGRLLTVLGVLGLAVIASGTYGAWWFFTTGRPGTVFASGTVGPGDRVLLAGFVNRSGDSTLAYALEEAIRVDLSNARLLRLVDQTHVREALQRMGLPSDTGLEDQGLAREVAERENAKAFITGDVSRIGGGYQLTAHVIASADGADLQLEREPARNEDDLVDAIGRLGRKLRRGLGESVRNALGRPALPKVTTHSIDALRAYATAVRLEDQIEDRPRAIRLLQEAVTRDSTFAMAYRKLSATLTNDGRLAEAREAADRAYRYRGQLPDLERLMVEAEYHNRLGDVGKEGDALRRLIELDPTNTTALSRLSNVQLVQRRFAEAEDLALNAINAGCNDFACYWNVVEAQVAQQRFAAAESVLAHVEPGRMLTVLKGSLLLSKRDWRAYSAFHATDSVMQVRRISAFTFSPALMAFVHGRLAEANRFWDSAERAGGPLDRVWWALYRLRYSADDTASVSHQLDAQLDRVGWDTLPPTGRREWLLVTVLADLGRIQEARLRLAKWRAASSPDPRLREWGDYCEGAIALAEGRLDSAAALFLRSNRAPLLYGGHLFNRGLVEAAAAVDRLGYPDSAVVLYESALTLPVLGFEPSEVAWYPFVLRRLAELHQSLGHRDQAIDYYGRFIDLWKDADPELQPQVDAARAALARLMEQRG